MKRLQDVAEQQEMTWTKSKGVFKPEYALRSANDVLATLRWREVFGSLAEGEAAGGKKGARKVPGTAVPGTGGTGR